MPMKHSITIQERLKDLRTERHLKLDELAAATGISKSAIGNYENNDYKEINHGNLITLAKFYGVSTDYLLCLTENRNHSNTELTELHLSDGMINLLKNGQINNRLLCEMAVHRDFIKLLADIEIYVDGIATMQVQNLNAYVDTVRHEIVEHYRPEETDPYLRILSAAHLEEEEYFGQLVSDDLKSIIHDIRAAHKGDSESAPVNSISEELLQNIEETMNFKGSDAERQAFLYCKQLGINYNSLDMDEFQQLAHILKKSSYLKGHGSKRRKRKC